VSAIDIAVVDSLKVLDPDRPITEADIGGVSGECMRSRLAIARLNWYSTFNETKWLISSGLL
jgi:hypothetical protein